MAKTSYQAAARLVEREAGAFFGSGRSRSAGTWNRARSGLHPSHGLRIDSVVLAMGAKEPDRQGSCPILEGRNQFSASTYTQPTTNMRKRNTGYPRRLAEQDA